MLNLDELLVFVRVVQAGSFTAAAGVLDMPKSSVSRRVAELEERIGARLLQRTTRKLHLTEVGSAYFERAARVVADAEEAEQAVSSMQAEPRGKLRVTAPLSFGMIGPTLSEYLSRYPEVQVEMSCTDRRVDLIEEGYDLAIRVGALGDSTYIARSLGTLRHFLVASPAYLKKRGVPKTPHDLAKHDHILFTSGARGWTLRRGSEVVPVLVRSRLAVNDFDIVLAGALAGMGVASMPELVCSAAIRDRRLCEVLPEWSAARSPVHAIYPSGRHLSPKVKSFVDLVAERLELSP
jgi:DNA-binding transcriptional LysR family regulator